MALYAQSSGTHSTNSSTLVPIPGLSITVPEGVGISALIILNVPNPYATGIDYPGGTFGADDPLRRTGAPSASGAGGAGLMSACDFAVATRDAKFGYPEVRRGLVPALIMTFLRRQLRERDARELLLLGKLIDATHAYAIGLVNRVAEPEGLDALLAEYTGAITTGAPLTIKAGKRIIRDVLKSRDPDMDLARKLILECFESEDYAEGRRAFMEKRKPLFKGK